MIKKLFLGNLLGILFVASMFGMEQEQGRTSQVDFEALRLVFLLDSWKGKQDIILDYRNQVIETGKRIEFQQEKFTTIFDKDSVRLNSSLGDETMSYESLLKFLDDISGKKEAKKEEKSEAPARTGWNCNLY